MRRFPFSSRFLPCAGLSVALLLAAGCTTSSGSHAGPLFVPVNHAGDAVLPTNVRRVVLLPLAGGEVAPAASMVDLDPVVAAALQHQNRFEVITVSRDACRRLFSVEELSSVQALPPNFMAVIRHEFAADAVLFVDVTVFRAYRPLALGFRAKLATVTDVRLVWTFDNLFTASDPAVANSASRHLRTDGLPQVPADLGAAALQSPSRFTAYAAEAMFSTLPPLAAVGTPVPVEENGTAAR